jgi:hypothetical protein
LCISQLLLLLLDPALLSWSSCLLSWSSFLLEQTQSRLLRQQQQRLHVQAAGGKLRGVHENDTHLTLPQPQHIA